MWWTLLWMTEKMLSAILMDGDIFLWVTLCMYGHRLSLKMLSCLRANAEQLRTDGGAYTPTPTSITGNISGGVYGCFRVSAVSEKGILKGK